MIFHRSLYFKPILMFVALVSCTLSPASIAGGVSLGATRVIYPAEARQISLMVNNSDDKSRFLIQSWIEDLNGKKTNDFSVSPPLFMIGPEKENTLRISFNRLRDLPSDRETLYWFNAQAIPQQDIEKGQNVLQLASLSRIKMFVRPSGLQMKSIDAPNHIRFSTQGGVLAVHNQSPYYVTLVNFKVGETFQPNTMVAPKETVTLKSNGSGDITFSTINDYGAITPIQKGVMK